MGISASKSLQPRPQCLPVLRQRLGGVHSIRKGTEQAVGWHLEIGEHFWRLCSIFPVITGQKPRLEDGETRLGALLTSSAQKATGRPLPEDFEKIFKEHHELVYRAAYRI